jgi:hypothetical protein
MQDGCLRLKFRDRTPVFPSWAEQDERRVSALDIHGDCAATRRPDDHIWVMLAVLRFGDSDGFAEVVIGESG